MEKDMKSHACGKHAKQHKTQTINKPWQPQCASNTL